MDLKSVSAHQEPLPLMFGSIFGVYRLLIASMTSDHGRDIKTRGGPTIDRQ